MNESATLPAPRWRFPADLGLKPIRPRASETWSQLCHSSQVQIRSRPPCRGSFTTTWASACQRPAEPWPAPASASLSPPSCMMAPASDGTCYQVSREGEQPGAASAQPKILFRRLRRCDSDRVRPVATLTTEHSPCNQRRPRLRRPSLPRQRCRAHTKSRPIPWRVCHPAVDGANSDGHGAAEGCDRLSAPSQSDDRPNGFELVRQSEPEERNQGRDIARADSPDC